MTPPTGPDTAGAGFEARFYAPQARLVDEDGVVLGDTARLEDRVQLDLVSARVTLVNTNVAQLQVVLNNQRFDAAGMPTTPPWKYNQLDAIKFGQRIRLDLRYGDRPWTKMILAQVNDLQFSFPAGGGAQLTITGEDLLCLLKRAPETDQKFDAELSEEQLILRSIEAATKDAFVDSKGKAVKATIAVGPTTPPPVDRDGVVTTKAGLVAWPKRSRGLPPLRHSTNQTYLQFIQNIADRMDLEVFVDFESNFLPETEPLLPTTPPDAAPGATPAGTAAPQPDRASNQQVFHVEPARSLLPHGEEGAPAERRIVDLRWGQNLIEFTPKLKVWDLVTAVRIKGRPRLSSTPINATITGADADKAVGLDLAEVAGEVAFDDDGTTPLPPPWSAVRLREQLLAEGTKPITESVEFTNLDEDRVVIKAFSQLRARARDFLTVEAQTIGFPTLRAGLHVRIAGLSVPFNGIYYVTKAVHVFDASGYKTSISLRRPGMIPPKHLIEQEAERARRAAAGAGPGGAP
jgi:hypothetical protein